MSHRPRRSRHGFTLVELLVVIAIIGVLVALLLPAVQAAREAARRATCLSRQKQVVQAALDYEGANRAYPAGRVGCDDLGESLSITACPPGLPASKKTAASGLVSLLPYLEQRALHDQLAVDDGGLWNRNVDDLYWYADEGKRLGIQHDLPIFRCPSDESQSLSDVYDPVVAATCSYALCQGSHGPGSSASNVRYFNDGLFVYVTRRRQREATDGLSTTLALGETVLADAWESSNTWSYSLANADCLRNTRNPLNTHPGAGTVVSRRNGAFGSRHPGGANFAFADGHVAFITDGVDMEAYRAMSTIAGGEPLSGRER
ncbi:MAG: DUF1559 domain-containing protein [Pirellulales bacterium]|nr:DUF1559 domain-containing protein [Pirellulales bacterium]